MVTKSGLSAWARDSGVEVSLVGRPTDDRQGRCILPSIEAAIELRAEFLQAELATGCG